MGKNFQQIIVYPKMSAIFSKIVRKQRLHACDFSHVCPFLNFLSNLSSNSASVPEFRHLSVCVSSLSIAVNDSYRQ